MSGENSLADDTLITRHFHASMPTFCNGVFLVERSRVLLKTNLFREQMQILANHVFRRLLILVIGWRKLRVRLKIALKQHVTIFVIFYIIICAFMGNLTSQRHRECTLMEKDIKTRPVWQRVKIFCSFAVVILDNEKTLVG